MEFSQRELALAFTTIAWMYSYLQWGLIKVLPGLWLAYHHPDMLGQIYFGLNLLGDTFLHYDCQTLGITSFYLSYTLLIIYMLSNNRHPNPLGVLGLLMLIYLPSFRSTYYAFAVYGIVSVYGLALAIPFSKTGPLYIAESFLLLLLSDILVLGEILGWPRLQPWALTLYYGSQLLMAKSRFKEA